jgi:DNA invertase Pin-like site-specific DNA recombinase
MTLAKAESPPALPLIPYVRVSRVGGRDRTDGYISTTEQLKQIEGYAQAFNFTLTAPITEEDVSGKSMDRRDGLERALRMVERGQAGGIIAARLNRIARNARDSNDIAERVEKAGGRLVAVADQIDLSSVSGRFVFQILAALAQMELEQITESWRVAQTNAIIDRGIHVSRHVPFGYRKNEQRRLEPDSETAPIVKEIFRRRAKKPPESWGSIVEWLNSTEHRIVTIPKVGAAPRRAEAWTRTTVQGIVRNRVYLGEAHAVGKGKDGPVLDLVNSKAHKAIVSPSLFERAQPGKAVAERDGYLADQCLLRGLVVCEYCGHRMVVLGATSRGERVASYHCRKHFADGTCPNPVAIQARRLDPYVEEQFLARLREHSRRPRAVRLQRSDRLAKLDAELQSAEAELEAFLGLDFAGVPEHLVHKEKAERITRFEEAQTALANERDRLAVRTEIDRGDLLERWPELSREAKRRVIRAALGEVRILHADGKRGRAALAVPIEHRVKGLTWASDMLG